MFGWLYNCPNHGEIIHIEIIIDVDIEHDEIYEIPVCKICAAAVEPIMQNGKHLMRPLTEEEIKQEFGYYESWD